ncbi:MAG: hypothetical protein OXC68_12870 [Aestuariivita sp.]|nr:hypothetical protein [Aestuariivita sp.]
MTNMMFVQYNTTDHLKSEKNIAAYLEAVTENTEDDPACIADARNMTTLTHETRSG